MTLRAAVAALAVELVLLAAGVTACWRWAWRRARHEAHRKPTREGR